MKAEKEAEEKVEKALAREKEVEERMEQARAWQKENEEREQHYVERDAWFEQEKARYASERLSEYRKENEFQKDDHNQRVVKLKEAERDLRAQIQRNEATIEWLESEVKKQQREAKEDFDRYAKKLGYHLKKIDEYEKRLGIPEDEKMVADQEKKEEEPQEAKEPQEVQGAQEEAEAEEEEENETEKPTGPGRSSVIAEFTHLGYIWHFNKKTQQYRAAREDKKGAPEFKNTPVKGRETWNAVVDIYKKHSVWLNNAKEVERWQEEQDQKRVEKLVHERLQQEQFQYNQKGKGKKPTNPGKGWGWQQDQSWSNQQWQEAGWYDQYGNYHETWFQQTQ